jgi:hypothetical protein
LPRARSWRCVLRQRRLLLSDSCQLGGAYGAYLSAGRICQLGGAYLSVGRHNLPHYLAPVRGNWVGTECLVIGGRAGRRSPALRLSAARLAPASACEHAVRQGQRVAAVPLVRGWFPVYQTHALSWRGCTPICSVRFDILSMRTKCARHKIAAARCTTWWSGCGCEFHATSLLHGHTALPRLPHGVH